MFPYPFWLKLYLLHQPGELFVIVRVSWGPKSFMLSQTAAETLTELGMPSAGSALTLGSYSSHPGLHDSEMGDLVSDMGRLCDRGFDAAPVPKWLNKVTAHEKGDLARYRRKVMSTTEDERIERLQAQQRSGLDERGRPTLRGIVPDRSSSHRSRPPMREDAMTKVIKCLEKVKISNKYRRSRPRPRARIQGLDS